MSQVIEFLDAAGSNAQLSAVDYAASVAMLQVDADEKRALLDRDHLALAALLDGRTETCCHISLPDGDEPEPMQDDEDDIPEKEE
ncbi:MAG: hypothetical protein M3414_04765 [Pseudomonadota bacterium]|nr:hypothetical protein [Pseudomonadota bacterium]